MNSDSMEQNFAALRDVRVAVTGASGFVGSHLTRTLVRAGARVSALFPEPAAPRLADINYERMPFDLRETERVRTVLSACRPEIVFHLGAYGVQRRDRDVGKAVSTNVAGAAAIMEGAAEANARLVVQIGTSAEYGGSENPIREDAALLPAGIYAATKAAGMLVGRARARELGVRWVGLRPFVTYGPGEDRDKLVPYVITRALAGEPVLTTPGEQVRDFTFVEDLVEGMALAAVADLADGEIVNLGSGVGVAVADVVRLLATLVDGADLRFGTRPLSVDDVQRQIADLTKQRALMPSWRPRTGLQEGLRRTVEWFAGQGARLR